MKLLRIGGSLRRVFTAPIEAAGVAGTSDHGSLTGLADDDHGHYHNNVRGDARYYTKAEIDALDFGGDGGSALTVVDNVIAFNGGGQTNATQLLGDHTIQVITTVTAHDDSVKLPIATTDAQVVVANRSPFTILVFPSFDQSIDGLAPNMAVSIEPNLVYAFYGRSASEWLSIRSSIVTSEAIKHGIVGFGATDFPVDMHLQPGEPPGSDGPGITWTIRTNDYDDGSASFYDLIGWIDKDSILFHFEADGGKIADVHLINGAVTLVKMASLDEGLFIGRRASAGTGQPQTINAAQATVMLNEFTDSLKGLVPPPGSPGSFTKFLNDAQAWESIGHNDLDDVELGTFTPGLSFVTNGNENIVLSVAQGNYALHDNRCFFQLRVVTSTFTHSTAAGALEITALPFTPSATVPDTPPFSCSAQGWTLANRPHIQGVGVSGAPRAQIRASGSGVAMINTGVAQWLTGAAVEIEMCGVYKV